MSVKADTKQLVCDQCGKIGPTLLETVKRVTGWVCADRIKEERKVIDLCPKCKVDWEKTFT